MPWALRSSAVRTKSSRMRLEASYVQRFKTFFEAAILIHLVWQDSTTNILRFSPHYLQCQRLSNILNRRAIRLPAATTAVSSSLRSHVPWSNVESEHTCSAISQCAFVQSPTCFSKAGFGSIFKIVLEASNALHSRSKNPSRDRRYLPLVTRSANVDHVVDDLFLRRVEFKTNR